MDDGLLKNLVLVHVVEQASEENSIVITFLMLFGHYRNSCGDSQVLRERQKERGLHRRFKMLLYMKGYVNGGVLFDKKFVFECVRMTRGGWGLLVHFGYLES